MRGASRHWLVVAALAALAFAVVNRLLGEWVLSRPEVVGAETLISSGYVEVAFPPPGIALLYLLGAVAALVGLVLALKARRRNK